MKTTCDAAKEEVRLVARQAAPAAINWIQTSRRAKLIHVFDHVCYLANEDGAVVACVTPEVRIGPFSVVVEWTNQFVNREASFAAHLSVESTFRACTGHLHIGSLTIDTTSIQFWCPRPAWDQLAPLLLYGRLLNLENSKGASQVDDFQVRTPHSWQWAWQHALKNGWQALACGLITGQPADLAAGARQLAGLGPGLTPAGDDFLVGTLHAIWATRPHAEALLWSEILTSAAVPRTTTVSAAWLKAAGRGEATQAWHDLATGLIHGDTRLAEEATQRIMSTGSTSGRVALHAFERAARTLLNARKSASRD